MQIQLSLFMITDTCFTQQEINQKIRENIIKEDQKG